MEGNLNLYKYINDGSSSELEQELLKEVIRLKFKVNGLESNKEFKGKPKKAGKLELIKLALTAYQTNSKNYHEYELRVSYKGDGTLIDVTFDQFEDILKEKLSVIEFK